MSNYYFAGHGRHHRKSFPINILSFQVIEVISGGVVVVACRIIVSASASVTVLDFGFETLDLDFGLRTWTWA